MCNVSLIMTFCTPLSMKMKSEYRPLFQEEIEQLETQGCSAENWNNVFVSLEFVPERVREVCFSGEIRLGCFQKEIAYPGGISKPAGIYRATLHQVTVGNNCRIADIHDYIAHYEIEADCLIEHVDSLYVEGETTFGNGVRVAVLNEAGGREVVIHDQLSAQMAYMQCTYRHDEALQSALERISNEYVESKQSSSGRIGTHTRIAHCGRICNVAVGGWSVLEGVIELEEGTLRSVQEAPVRLGRGVTARHFILLPGAQVEDNVSLLRCLIGEASFVGNGFTATDSLVFANCHLENGEACSLFAGPFTVSHHKSTLLIGVMTSFMNAGSGTNQSNHAYKLGPIHYGILERGCRTGSGSYLLWPSRIGAFSTVIGHVMKHIDTSGLPFSYIIGEGEKVYIAPGATLRSIGTWRDAEKWLKRDGRKAPFATDVINMEVFSAYTVFKMFEAVHLLRELMKKQGKRRDEYTYKNAFIKRSSLENGILLYQQAARYWSGGKLLEIESEPAKEIDEYMHFRVDGDFMMLFKMSVWRDLAGALLTEEKLDYILQPLYKGEYTTPQELNEAFRKANREMSVWATPSVRVLRCNIWEKGFDEPKEFVEIASLWERDSIALLNTVLADGQKEFAPSMKLSSGIDAKQEEERELDFERSGGSMAGYPFFAELYRKIEEVQAGAATLIKKYKTGK